MAKQRIEVEIDVPEGEEFVHVVAGVPLFGMLEKGEASRKYFTIVTRPAFDVKAWWPEWLNCSHVAMNPDGYWLGFTEKPRLLSDRWASDWCSKLDGFRLDSSRLAFTPPPHITDWRQSLLANPHLEARS